MLKGKHGEHTPHVLMSTMLQKRCMQQKSKDHVASSMKHNLTQCVPAQTNTYRVREKEGASPM